MARFERKATFTEWQNMREKPSSQRQDVSERRVMLKVWQDLKGELQSQRGKFCGERHAHSMARHEKKGKNVTA
jgi:hypothetical protein